MRLSGTLKSWKDDRGFGFIEPAHGGADLFVHISALPGGARPTAGERLTYELGRGRNGQPQALNVERIALGSSPSGARSRMPEPRQERSYLPKIIGLVLVVALAAIGFNQYQKRTAAYRAQPRTMTPQSAGTLAPEATMQGFRCDGRRYCSQMKSCTEAKFFLENCPRHCDGR